MLRDLQQDSYMVHDKNVFRRIRAYVRRATTRLRGISQCARRAAAGRRAGDSIAVSSFLHFDEVFECPLRSAV